MHAVAFEPIHHQGNDTTQQEQITYMRANYVEDVIISGGARREV